MSSPNETSTASSEETTAPGPPGPSRDSTLPAPSDETLVGASAAADASRPRIPSAPGAQSIHNQDTVVSPRLRQLATTPSQPLRPPPGAPPKKPTGFGLPIGASPARLRLLIGIVAVLILLALTLVAALLATQGPALMARLNPTRVSASTPTPMLAAAPTSVFPPTFTPTRVPPTLAPTPIPPTATPRPAPSAIAVDVLVRVKPPEGVKLKVRASPGTGAQVRGELDKDAQVAILEGPQQASGLTWWKVDDGKGLVGWSAEGVGNDKYLVPIGWVK